MEVHCLAKVTVLTVSQKGAWKAYPKTWSICSKVLPLVSGTMNHTKRMPRVNQPAKKIYKPHEMLANMVGVMSAMMKLFIQFAEAAIDVPLARSDRGKTSAIRVHDAGPHE